MHLRECMTVKITEWEVVNILRVHTLDKITMYGCIRGPQIGSTYCRCAWANKWHKLFQEHSYLQWWCCWTFSSFSVGCCINASVTNLSSENNFAIECSSHHQDESEEVQTNIAIYSHALPRIHIKGWWGLLLLSVSSSVIFWAQVGNR